MTTTHPFIIETQLRLIRAFQKGYIEALEAGDWQAADYRGSHLQKLCEWLYHLTQSLDRRSSIPEAVTQKSVNSWVGSIRSIAPTTSSNPSPNAADKPMVSPPSPPDPARYVWGMRPGEGSESPPIDEVWH